MIAIAVAAPIALSLRESAQADPPPPNVVIILTDDQRFDELTNMPNVNALIADQGTRFTRYHFTTAVCCPSRAAMLSGQYNHNNGVTNNAAGANFDSSNSLATMLDTAGYQTSYIGKYLNGYSCGKPIPEGWDDWQALCYRVQNKYGYRIRDNAATVSYGSTTADYQTDVLNTRAVETLSEFATNGSPFFTVVAPTAPHGPLQPALRHKSAFPDYVMPKRPNFNEEDVSDKPAWIQALSPAKVISIDRSERKRLQMLLAVDDMVGDIVDELTTNGTLDNTIIMFASDNGFMRGEHRIRLGKDHLYTESVTGPFVMRGPGIPVGATNNALIGNVDLAPYIVARAGATPTIDFDGRDFQPTFADPLALENRAFLHHRPGSSRFPQTPSAAGITTEDGLRYTRFDNGVEELYDLLVDPYEMTNVANTPAYALVEGELATMLTTLRTCAGTPCHVTYNRPPVSSFSVTDLGDGDISVDGTASSDPGGTIASYAWNFGDGDTGTGATAAHTYLADGTYTITLTVTDDDGRTATTSQSITIDANEPPVTSFSEVVTDNNAAFDATASTDPDGVIVDYAWDFGDTNTGTGATPNHTYAANGTYTVTLTVTDDDGRTDSESHSVVIAAYPTAAFTTNIDNLDVAFDGSISTDPDGVIVDYAWDFGDANTGTGATPNHTYAADGTYTVTLTVTDDDGLTTSTSQTITVAANVPPVAAVTYLVTGLAVDVDATTSSDSDGVIVDYAWDFGDAGTGSGLTTTHTYAAPGTYTVTLTVTDDDGATHSTNQSVTVT